MARVLREAALWVVAALGAVCLAAAVAAVAFGMTPLIFSSGSMSPGIPTGSLAVAISTPAAELRAGDIVSTTWSSGERVTHRLVSMQQTADGSWSLTTRGDANNIADAEHPEVERVDRVVWSTPWWGYALEEATKPQWSFAMGGVVGALVVLAFRPRRVRATRAARLPRHSGAPRHEVRDAALAAVGSVAVLTIAASLLAPAPTETLASYVDSGQATSTLSTATIPAPTITGCTITNALGVFQSATLTFTMPGGYPKTSAVVGMGLAPGALSPVTPAPTVGGTGPYTYTYTSGLLTTILASLFGNTAYIGVRTADGTWNSAWATRKVVIGIAGLGSTCTVS